jgi:hypothetical protein
MEGYILKERRHRRDCGQEVLDGEVGNDNLILCHDTRDAVLGDCFHAVRLKRKREKEATWLSEKECRCWQQI